jgi:hypothetical protein
VVSSRAARWETPARRRNATSPPGRRRFARRIRLSQLRVARRILGIVVVAEVGALAVRLLDLAGFNHSAAIASMTVLTADVLASWCIIAHANRSRRPPRYRRQQL